MQYVYNMEKENNRFLFGKQNYILMIIGVALVIIGFLLMAGGGSNDPTVFHDKIYGFQRITLAPLLILAGFVIEFFAIFKK